MLTSESWCNNTRLASGIARGFEPDETDDEERGDGASNEQVKAFGD